MNVAVAERIADDLEPAVRDIAGSHIRPDVRRIDQEGFYPVEALRALGDVGAFAAHASADGSGLIDAIRAMAAVGETCVSSAFCMWCQDALVWYLAAADNPTPRQAYLADAASGRRLGGTGLSNPMKNASGIEPLALKGKRVDGGWRVTGRLPWVSNLGPDHLFASIFSGAPEAGRVMALFDCAQDGVKIAQNAHFMAMEGTATYTVMIRDAFVPDAHVLSADAAVFLPRIRAGFILLQTGMALGAVRGAVAQMRKSNAARAEINGFLPDGPDFFAQAADDLEARVEELGLTPFDTGDAYFVKVLRARLTASELSLAAAQSGLLHAGASGFILGSETARRFRETQFIAIVTPAIKHLRKEIATRSEA